MAAVIPKSDHSDCEPPSNSEREDGPARSQSSEESLIRGKPGVGIAWEMQNEAVRLLHLNGPKSGEKFCSNKIRTSKYSLLTWAPKSLILQFRRAANVYFLIICILSFMSFSPKTPTSLVGTFSAVIFFTMVKEAYEDYVRHQQDNRINSSPSLRLNHSTLSFDPTPTESLHVLDIVKIRENGPIPADMILLACSNDKGLAFVNTMNLDGETNLKERTAHELTKRMEIKELAEGSLEVACDLPSAEMHRWNCNLRLPGRDWTPLTPNQLLLRGCVLKNTSSVLGLVIYTGHDTKIMRNSKPAPSKASQVLKRMNKMLYTIFMLQAVICFVFAGVFLSWGAENADKHVYLEVGGTGKGSYVIQVLAFYVAYSHFVPISLYVMLEIVKLYLSRLINWDEEMYYEPDDRPSSCRTSDLVEELGQVSFLFTDKTGTLTQNLMEFKRCSVSSHIYTSSDVKSFFAYKCDEKPEEIAALDRLFTELSICHSVFPVMNSESELKYQAASPDELALVEGSASVGYIFTGKEDDRLTVKRGENEEETYRILAEIPFDSTRKRMSVVVEEPNGRTLLMCKGADNIILNLTSQSTETTTIKEHLSLFSCEGLRTLLIAQRYIPREEAENWLKGWKSVLLSNAKNKLELIDNQALLIEKDLEIVGVTAIEDKLQTGVPETIELLMQAKIRVWVLTGDKQETAIEIGKSCRLITPTTHLEDLTSPSAKDLLLKLQSCCEIYSLDSDLIDLEIAKKKRNSTGKSLGIVIDGPTFAFLAQNIDARSTFFKLGFLADSCICCRVSPAQKAEVVKLAKTAGKWVTLAIGDGANDVSMIQEAHIGVGIAGREGAQAVQASDFSFSQFRFLQRLLLVHGRSNYRRISWFICYYFYKNITVVFTEIWFAIFNGFSGQIYFADWLPQLYNSFWTSWPCMFAFVYERDLSASQSLRHPISYTPGQRSLYFTYRRFWQWIILAIIHGLICYWVPSYGFSKAINSDSSDSGLWLTSTLSFTLIIHVVTMKLYLESVYWTSVSM